VDVVASRGVSRVKAGLILAARAIDKGARSITQNGPRRVEKVEKGIGTMERTGRAE
jgi:hypothetical protein